MPKFYTIMGHKIETIELTPKFDIRFIPHPELTSYGEEGQKELARRQILIDQRAA